LQLYRGVALANPIGRPPSFRELLELVRRYRSLSPGARGVVLRVVAKIESAPDEERP
jgi:hypothetical protein